MSFIRHGGVVAAVVLAWLLGTASAGSALTVSPTGTYSLSTTGLTFNATSTANRIHCGPSRQQFSVTAAGTGTVALGGAAFASCTSPYIGAVTITQPLVWSVQVVQLAPGWR